MDSKETPELKVNRNIKDSVFRNLFSDKEYLFQLYQALHPEDKKTTIDELEYVTLENVLVWDIYNDLGMQAEKNAKETAWNFYKNGVKPDVIARSLNRNIKTIEQWLGLVPQA